MTPVIAVAIIALLSLLIVLMFALYMSHRRLVRENAELTLRHKRILKLAVSLHDHAHVRDTRAVSRLVLDCMSGWSAPENIIFSLDQIDAVIEFNSKPNTLRLPL